MRLCGTIFNRSGGIYFQKFLMKSKTFLRGLQTPMGKDENHGTYFKHNNVRIYFH
jgi:hypothetical protein